MKEDQNTLERAIEAIRNEQIPPGPGQELVDATVAKLVGTQTQSDTPHLANETGLLGRLRPVKGIMKFAAAAALFIVAGYAAGRASAPRTPNLEQLRTVLEPAIRRNVIAQLRDDLQLGLATCYDRLSDELGTQQREDMARFAGQMLAASNSATNQLIAELIQSIDTAQKQERQRFAAAMEQMELDRLRDKAQIASFAVRTDDELELMKQGVAQLLSSYDPLDNSAVHELENSDNTDEREEK